MIKLKLALLKVVIITLIPVLAFCQATIQEGSLIYDVTISALNTGKLSGNTQYSVFWKGALSRTEIRSSMGYEFSIYDGKSGSGHIFKEYSGQKLMIPLDERQWKEKNHTWQDLDFQILEVTEQKAGRSCGKAVATDASGREFTVWFDSSVIPHNLDYDFSFRKLPGLPVSIMMKSSKFEYSYLLTAFKVESLPMSLFEVGGKGYRTISYEELKKMKKE